MGFDEMVAKRLRRIKGPPTNRLDTFRYGDFTERFDDAGFAEMKRVAMEMMRLKEKEYSWAWTNEAGFRGNCDAPITATELELRNRLHRDNFFPGETIESLQTDIDCLQQHGYEILESY